jgi:hypothetical protein
LDLFLLHLLSETLKRLKRMQYTAITYVIARQLKVHE